MFFTAEDVEDIKSVINMQIEELKKREAEIAKFKQNRIFNGVLTIYNQYIENIKNASPDQLVCAWDTINFTYDILIKCLYALSKQEKLSNIMAKTEQASITSLRSKLS